MKFWQGWFLEVRWSAWSRLWRFAGVDGVGLGGPSECIEQNWENIGLDLKLEFPLH